MNDEYLKARQNFQDALRETIETFEAIETRVLNLIVEDEESSLGALEGILDGIASMAHANCLLYAIGAELMRQRMLAD